MKESVVAYIMVSNLTVTHIKPSDNDLFNPFGFIGRHCWNAINRRMAILAMISCTLEKLDIINIFFIGVCSVIFEINLSKLGGIGCNFFGTVLAPSKFFQNIFNFMCRRTVLKDYQLGCPGLHSAHYKHFYYICKKWIICIVYVYLDIIISLHKSILHHLPNDKKWIYVVTLYVICRKCNFLQMT